MPVNKLLIVCQCIHILSTEQALQSITGFQRLREIHTLVIQENRRLVHVDGFGGILSVHTAVIQSNALCYILNETPDSNYWEVCFFNKHPGHNKFVLLILKVTCTHNNNHCSTMVVMMISYIIGTIF